VLIPAAGDSSGTLTTLLREIGATRLVFALDLPGHGRSGNPPAGSHPTEWVRRWMDRLGFEHCHLLVAGTAVGLGGSLGATAPSSIVSLTLLGVATRRRRTPELPHVSELPSLARRTGSHARSLSARKFVRKIASSNPSADLARVTAPVLVVHGEDDVRASRDAAAAVARSAHGTFIELPDVGRTLSTGEARDLATTLERWWMSVEATDTSGRERNRAPRRTER
jgi:pimeloyl-ACP methyl ester carboxylesterase